IEAVCAQLEARGVTVDHEVEHASDAVLAEVELTVVAEERAVSSNGRDSSGDAVELAAFGVELEAEVRVAERKARYARTSPARVADSSRSGGSSDPVRMYLKEIGRVPLLSGPQEVDLARRIEAGKDAEEKLADLAASGELAEL